MTIRTLIVDDEKPARMRIRELLEKEHGIEVIGECTNGKEAIQFLQHESPDLLFLDVQMPEVDGFGVLDQVGLGTIPVTIFVTAYDKYALRAFDVHALDYLLKPYSDERFSLALSRAREHLRGQQRDVWAERLGAFLDDYHKPLAAHPATYLDRLAIKSNGRVYLVKTTDIAWIEAAGVYVTLHAGSKRHLYREQIGRLASQLDPQHFVRIHRSTIVNIDHIEELLPNSHGEYTVVLKDQTHLRLSRTFRSHLQQRLGQGL